MPAYGGCTQPERNIWTEQQAAAQELNCDMIRELFRRAPRRLVELAKYCELVLWDSVKICEWLTRELAGLDADADRQMYRELKGG